MSRITALETADVRFPTSLTLDGSDAMNPDPDYSAAYVRVVHRRRRRPERARVRLHHRPRQRRAGRGDRVPWPAHLVGRDVEALLADLGGTWRELVHDSQLRWLGPEKGVMHMAIGAVVNALWDLRAKREGLPLWQLLASLTPEELVDLVDFRYLTDALTRDEALELLRAAEPGRAEREAQLLRCRLPRLHHHPRLAGLRRREARPAVPRGGGRRLPADQAQGRRRPRRGRAPPRAGPGGGRSRRRASPSTPTSAGTSPRRSSGCGALAPYDLAWVEEPTSPDDVLGHAAIARGIAPVPVATGEHMANRVMFKQFLQADALQVLQIDATRVAGVNENVAILLLAAKFGVPVCPHAGGVGLCEAVQHLSMFDFVAVAGSQEGR